MDPTLRQLQESFETSAFVALMCLKNPFFLEIRQVPEEFGEFWGFPQECTTLGTDPPSSHMHEMRRFVTIKTMPWRRQQPGGLGGGDFFLFLSLGNDNGSLSFFSSFYPICIIDCRFNDLPHKYCNYQGAGWGDNYIMHNFEEKKMHRGEGIVSSLPSSPSVVSSRRDVPRPLLVSPPLSK